MIDNSTKQQIQELLNKYCEKVGGKNAASKKLTGASVATVSNIVNGKWESISDALWRNIAKQVGFKSSANRVYVPTISICRAMNDLFNDARTYSNVFAAVAPEGSGKTEFIDYFAANDEEVIKVKCTHYFNQRDFLQAILRAMGEKNPPFRLSDMMRMIVSRLLRMENPLLIIDELEKVKNDVICFIITLYNELKGKCGIVIVGTLFLQKRIERGVEKNLLGYREFYSRVGRKFIPLPVASKKDVRLIAEANGVSDELEITQIINGCENDLRRVDRLLHSYHLQNVA